MSAEPKTDRKKCSKPDKIPADSIHLLQIQTILSVLELHQISTCALADFTADREFHPALKTSHWFSCLRHYIRWARDCQ